MSLLTKLRFAPSTAVYVLGDAEGVALLTGPESFGIKHKLPGKAAIVQQVILFTRDTAALKKDFSTLLPKLAEDVVLWIAYPKKSSAIKSDLTRDIGWAVVAEAGYEGVTQVALDSNWSAVRFRKREAISTYLRGTPMSERITEGVDYTARTVSLPPDAASALEAHSVLHDFFNSLSFSHKREWAEAIADAKKPETRARRIAKMVDDLHKQKEAKAAKQKK